MGGVNGPSKDIAHAAPPTLLDRRTVYGPRAKLGLIVPPTNTANEAEWWSMAPAGVSIHATRMPLHADTSNAQGRNALLADIAHHARDIAEADVDLVVYACTAGSMVTPVTELPDYMRRETGRASITTAQAIIAALDALDAKRICVGTPYHDALNDHEAAFLEAHSKALVAIEGLGYGANGPDEYRNIARLTPAEVEALARRVARPGADALLLSCTDLATLTSISRLESELGLPVISSNTATFWLALRTVGLGDRIDGAGALFQRK
jgi:maleate cis-trans isomerase